MSKNYSTVNDLLSEFSPTKGRALVIGSKSYGGKLDRRSLYRRAVGLDLEAGAEVDIVHDLESPLPPEHGKFDHIDCCSVMEHVQRPWLMAENIQRAMRPGATILISVPFSWRIHNYPGDYWRFTRQTLNVLFPQVKWLESGYLTDDGFRKVANGLELDNKVYIRRTEVIGFGLFNS